MKQYNHKFEDHLEKRAKGEHNKRVTDRQGIVLGYNPMTNTASVALSGQDSDLVTDIIKNVPCPTYNGMQLSAPEAGRHCWVTFKGGRESQPMITHFYNHDYQKYDYRRMNKSKSDIPKYLMY
jgi:hypothetical protein